MEVLFLVMTAFIVTLISISIILAVKLDRLRNSYFELEHKFVSLARRKRVILETTKEENS